MATVELVRPDSDSAEWSGRTALSGSLHDLKSALLDAGEDTAKTPGAATVLLWLESLEDYPPERVETAEVKPAGATGDPIRWTPTPPEEPQLTPPLPFEFLLPKQAGVAPLDALAPWWNEIALGTTNGGSEIAVQHGKRLDMGPWSEKAGRWSTNPASRFGVSSRLSVFSDRLEATTGLESKAASISDPGFVGSLVPGYGELKSLASWLSEKTEFIEAGCRISFGWISALAYTSNWNLKAPLLNRRLKKLVKERGYGEHIRTEIAVELSDGWQPYQLRLVSELQRGAEEDRPFEFFKSLVKAVASDRLQRPGVSEDQRERIAEVAASEPAHQETRSEAGSMGDFSRKARVELPGHRPVSAALGE
jgi:hypothetical protein